MKHIRLLLLAACVLTAGSMTAQQPKGLYIHSLKGQVMYRAQASGTWTAPAVKQPVSRLDSLLIGEGSQVMLVDGSNDNVYTLTGGPKNSILRHIQAARNRANGILVSVAHQLADNAMGRGAKAEAMTITGVTTRTEEEDRLHETIACMALAAARRYEAGEKTCDPLLQWQTTEEDGLIHFVISNGSRKAYCVNILAMNGKDKSVSLRIVPSPDVESTALIVPAGERLDLSMYRFVTNADMTYTLFATEEAYVPSAVQGLMKYPEDLKCEYDEGMNE